MTFPTIFRSQNQKHTFRRILAQFVATTIKNMLQFNVGAYLSFSGIVIPALTGVLNEHNRNETLKLTPIQTSWIGSIGFICQPIGCFLSPFLTDSLGRKRAMLSVNVPFIIAWCLMYQAQSVAVILIASGMMGMGIGLLESPVITYIGEISEPSLRGILIAYTSAMFSFGMLFVFTLNTLFAWRTVALICMFIPILTVIGLCFVPETPIWLLSKGRIAEAERSLCWLRGWAPKESIAQELESLKQYSERAKSCDICIAQNAKCSHPLPTMSEKCRELKRPETLKPLFIIASIFAINSFSGIVSMLPFIVQIFKAYDSPIAPDRMAAFMSVTNVLGIVSCMSLIRFTGKRPLYLAVLVGILLSAGVLSVYGFVYLPSGYNSFDQAKHFSMEIKSLCYIPIVCIVSWSFLSCCGVSSLGWQLVSETFPFRTRGVAGGIVAALSYFLSFVSIKTYYNLETMLSLPGITLFNCILVAIGLICMYNILPETEGYTLEDIERHFANKSKRITDHKIQKTKSKDKNVECVSGKSHMNTWQTRL